MYLESQVKTRVEKVEKTYLCDNFQLRPGSECPEFFMDGAYPDLFGIEPEGNPKTFFELKTRHFPRNRGGKQKLISQYTWWDLNIYQIQRYENLAQTHDLDLFWIFLIGQTEKQVSEIENLCEDSILERDIFVVPWEAKMLPREHSGYIRYLGLGKIKRAYDFREHCLEKCRLFLEGNNLEKLSRYF